MISHKHRFIYIPIPKSGSTTLKSYFQREARGFGMGFKEHSVPSWLEKSGRVSLGSLCSDYFVFSFVRNPFDRFLSFFLHGLRMVKVTRRRNLMTRDGYVPPYYVPPYKSLEECAEQTQQGLWHIKEDQYIGQNNYPYRTLFYEREHSRLQVDFLLDPDLPTDRWGGVLDASPCSFIGKLEHFNQDFTSLLSFLGCPLSPIRNFNVSYERKLRVTRKRRHYSTYYTKRARRLVEEMYARDLELLGYEFEDKTKTSVPVSLYDMDQLQERRTKTTPSRKHIKLYLVGLYLIIRSFLRHPKRTLLHLRRRGWRYGIFIHMRS